MALAVFAAAAIVIVGIASCEGSWKVFQDDSPKAYVVRPDEGSMNVVEDNTRTGEPVAESEARVLETHEEPVVETETVEGPDYGTWQVFRGNSRTTERVDVSNLGVWTVEPDEPVVVPEEPSTTVIVVEQDYGGWTVFRGNSEPKRVESSSIGIWTVVPDVYAKPTTEELEEALNSWYFEEEFEAHVFDCSDMTLIAAEILDTGYDYNVYVTIGMYDDETTECHAWAFVETSDRGWVAVETTLYPENCIGTVIEFDEYAYYNDIIYLGRRGPGTAVLNGEQAPY